jgi:hypothetical protein
MTPRRYASVDNPGVADLEKAAKEFFGKATTTFSPFDRGTFEPLLRTAATNLDANGIYWPDEVPADDRTLTVQHFSGHCQRRGL